MHPRIAVYGFVIFLSAFLSFQVQLILGKYFLPWFGGTPALFLSCIFFFQLGLVVGYGYVHFSSGTAFRRSTALIQLAVALAALALLVVRRSSWPSPITPGAEWKPASSADPIWGIVGLLAISVGLPYFALSTTSPILQRWYSSTHGERPPYALYAISNVGSLLGLITYPLFVEPTFTIRNQALLWCAGFGVFALAMSYLALRLLLNPARAPQSGFDAPHPEPPNPDSRRGGNASGGQSAKEGGASRFWSRFIRCAALAGCAAAMLLATTNQICQNVAAVPLLWVLPLTLYLLSFIVCFASERAYSRRAWSWALAAATALVSYALFAGPRVFGATLGIYSLALFACCMVCHGEVVRLKPGPADLTSFYLSIAVGGVIGSAGVLFLAPIVFKTFFWELPVSLWTCWLLLALSLVSDKQSWLYSGRPWLLGLSSLVVCARPLGGWRANRTGVLAAAVILAATAVAFWRAGRSASFPEPAPRVAVKALIALLLLAFFLPVFAFTRPIAVSRGFFGILTVLEGDGPSYLLKHGRTLHGRQFLSNSRKRQPTTYYCDDSGIGLALLNHSRAGPGNLRIGVVGLGVGTLAAYGRAGDYFRFYELDPDVIRFAQRYFTFIQDSAAAVDVVPGDARISMTRESGLSQQQRFDVLAIDAFSGDAIPVHLLTQEAFKLYLRQLEPTRGILAVHISNDALDFRPVLLGLTEYFHLTTVLVQSSRPTDGCQASVWALMASTPDALGYPAIASAGLPLGDGVNPVLWTDDYSNLFRALRY